MSAQGLGTSLLGEVRLEGLDELLQSLRTFESTNRAKIDLPVVDRLLNVFQYPVSRQPQNNTQRSTQHPGIRQRSLSKRSKPSVIEFTSALPCSGKTQLIYQITTLFILPSFHNEHHIHGKDEAVVVLDLDNNFSVLRLQQILSSHLRSLEVPLQEEDIASLIRISLQHLHIFRPQSFRSLLATIESFSTYLFDIQSHFSANRAIGLLVLNGLSAYLWQDRLDAEEAGLIDGGMEREKNGKVVQKYRDLVVALSRAQQILECTIIATNWGLAPVQYTSGHPALRPHLPSIWTNFCTLRLVVERNTVSKLGPGMSAEEAAKEGLQRQEAVDESGFSCWVNWWGSEGWKDEVREEVNSRGRGAAFSFRIDGDGLMIDQGESLD